MPRADPEMIRVNPTWNEFQYFLLFRLDQKQDKSLRNNRNRKVWINFLSKTLLLETTAIG